MPESLPHAERVLAGPLVGHLGEPDDVEDLVDPGAADVVGLGQEEEVVVGGARRVEGLGVEERAHLAQRPRRAAA